MVHGIEKGVYAAALTPLRSDLRCDGERLADHCLQLIDRGCKGVVLFGTTGEGPSFSSGEKIECLKQVIAKGLDPRKIIVGNGASCLQDTVDLAAAAVKSQCLACLIAPPCFFKNVAEEGVLAYYREVIKGVADPRLKVILYHFPFHTGVPLTVNIVKTLCEEFPGVVIGIKESEGNISFVKELLQKIPQCQVFVGKETLIPAAKSYGGSGSICGMANLWPELICDVYEGGDLAQLEKITALFDKRPFIASCKALLSSEVDPSWRLVRPPLVPAKQEEVRLLEELLGEVAG